MGSLTKALIRAARGKLKKAVRNKPLNTRQQRFTKNAFDTMDVLEQDAFIPSKKIDPKTSTPGVSKLDAIIGSKRIRNIIDTIASDKVKSQTDGVNALLQGAGVGFAVGYDSARDKKPIKKTKTKAPIFTLGIGENTDLVDISLYSIDVPTVVLKGDDVILKVTIQSFGIINERLSI